MLYWKSHIISELNIILLLSLSVSVKYLHHPLHTLQKVKVLLLFQLPFHLHLHLFLFFGDIRWINYTWVEYINLILHILNLLLNFRIQKQTTFPKILL